MTRDERRGIAVVGGSLAGLRAAEQLRSAGHTEPITVYSDEPHLPYNRPPLSKEVLADPEHHTAELMFDRLAFRRRKSTADVDFRLGARVRSADIEAGTLTLDSGAGTSCARSTTSCRSGRRSGEPRRSSSSEPGSSAARPPAPCSSSATG